MWELASPMPCRALLSSNQSNPWCRFDTKCPMFPSSWGTLAAAPHPLRLPCTIPCNSTGVVSGGINQVPLRNLCECLKTPNHFTTCAVHPSLPTLWNLLFRHPLGQGFGCINQTHKLCLKPLWCLTKSREEGWHLSRKVMRTLFCPWRGHRCAQRCCPAWGKGNRSALAWPGQSNPMCSQIHHQFPLWLPVDKSLHVRFLKDAFKQAFLLFPSSRLSSLYLSTKHCHYAH